MLLVAFLSVRSLEFSHIYWWICFTLSTKHMFWSIYPLTFKKSGKFRFPWSSLSSEPRTSHMSGLVLSWVATDVTVLVVSTQQLMHIIMTQTLQLVWPQVIPLYLLWFLSQDGAVEFDKPQAFWGEEKWSGHQQGCSVYRLTLSPVPHTGWNPDLSKSRQFYRMYCGV